MVPGASQQPVEVGILFPFLEMEKTQGQEDEWFQL